MGNLDGPAVRRKTTVASFIESLNFCCFGIRLARLPNEVLPVLRPHDCHCCVTVCGSAGPGYLPDTFYDYSELSYSSQLP